MRSIFLILLIIPLLCAGHGGGLDGSGGHFNRKTGEYHCHREPCFSRKQKEEANEGASEAVALYNRADWPHWIDEDGDCQDARAEMLIALSEVPVKFKRNKGCVVSWGRWAGPYTGQVFEKASDLDIDHLVPLQHAHGHGGDKWTRERRRQFANDPLNLVPVSASENREKGAKGPDSWRPDNKGYWCTYARRWEEVKATYGLYQTPGETMALAEMKAACP